MPGKWYIVQVISSHEDKVARAIERCVKEQNLGKLVEEIIVPSHEVMEVRAGKKTKVDKKFFPGYVLVKMDLSNEVWHMIKKVPNVIGFLGGSGKPQPISDREAERMLKQVEEGDTIIESQVVFTVGETVKVTDGPFESFSGVIDDVDTERKKLKVAVSIFGRSTPVELLYTQVEKEE